MFNMQLPGAELLPISDGTRQPKYLNVIDANNPLFRHDGMWSDG
jgi:hypothetical protein